MAATVALTLFEGYDFVVYGFMLPHIAKAIFSSTGDIGSLLTATATFGAGFVMRPVGAVVLGGVMDRRGRRAGLSLMIGLMAVGTAIVALTPGRIAIGYAAPLIFVAGRLLQGFAAGGAFGGAATLLIEHGARVRRGFVGSLQQISQGVSALLGSLVAAIVVATISAPHMDEWGWRLPFLLGLLIVPVGLVLRAVLADAAPSVRSAEPPRVALWREHRGTVLRAIGIVALATVGFYTLLVYMPTYAKRELAIPAPVALATDAVATLCFVLASLASGAWSDRVGRRRPMLLGAAGLFLLALPLVGALVAVPDFTMLLVVQIAFAALIGLYNGPALTFVGELFPRSVRASGYSISYNVAVVTFGGFAPFVTTWLIAATGSKLALALYIMVAAVLGFVAILSSRGRPTLRIATALIVDEDERLLLVRKAGTARFMQPGGKIEPGETPLAALRRELAEEIGARPDERDIVALGRFVAPAANEPDHRIDAQVYLVRRSPVLAIGAEIVEARWVGAAEAAALPLAPLTRDHLIPLSRTAAVRAFVRGSQPAFAAAPRPARSPPPPRR